LNLAVTSRRLPDRFDRRKTPTVDDQSRFAELQGLDSPWHLLENCDAMTIAGSNPYGRAACPILRIPERHLLRGVRRQRQMKERDCRRLPKPGGN
jgi:hypothetical protein